MTNAAGSTAGERVNGDPRVMSSDNDMFLNLVMLAGLGGAVVPLVLHLLARARCREVQWGAMMFLDGTEASQARTTRVKQWTLLALRMALVATLAVALARPIIRGRLGTVGQDGQVRAVIVLDCSYSMAFQEAGRSRFEQAKEAVLQILAALGKGDEVSLVLLGDQVDTRAPTSNLQAVARDVADLQVSSGWANIAQGLAAARQVLDQPGRSRRELYVVCDRQASSWKNADASQSYAQWVSDPRVPVRFHVVPIGGDDTQVAVIESVELVESVAVRDQPAEVEIRVHNYGSTPRVGLELTLSVIAPADSPDAIVEGGPKLKTVTMTVGALSSSSIRVPTVFEQVGSHILSVRLNTPGPEADTRFDSAVEVISPIDVLIVSGDESGEGAGRESFFPKLALTPRQTAQNKPGDPAVVRVVSAEDWSGEDLGTHQVVILANVPQVSPEQARLLEQKAYEGGGLIICPGNLSRVDSYNNVLYRGGQGLLPARLDSPVAADGTRSTTLLGMELAHPIFRFRRGGDPLPSAVIARYFPCTPRPVDARVLATYSSGEPFLVEGPRGRGRVLLLTTPLDADWNTLPLSPFYLPLVQSMVRYACAPSLPPRNLGRGQPLLASFEDVPEELQLTRWGERIAPPGRSMQVRYIAQRPGAYRLQARIKGTDHAIYFVVQPPRREESDPTSVSSARWAELEHVLGFSRLDPSGETLATTLTDQRSSRELWLTLLVGVIVLGVGELWLARLWSQEVA